jgi:predicted signal transduction protein with EAL and GGDEF domain
MEREALARMKIEQSLRLAILEKRFAAPSSQGRYPDPGDQASRRCACATTRGDSGSGTFINLATELGLIDELTHLVLAEIVKSIDLINETFGPDTTISINVAANRPANPNSCAVRKAIEATGFQALHDRGDGRRLRHQDAFQDEILPISRKLGVKISIDDFGILFVAVGAGRHYRRRDQDRPLLHHRHP